MNEPSPALTHVLRAYQQGETPERALPLALFAVADAVAPAPMAPPSDFDLEEWGRYSKQAAIRRAIIALAKEILASTSESPIRPD